MCGITGWISWQQDLSSHQPIIRRMAETLSHRGPDAANTYASPHALLGHTRLIVIDPEGGGQPMIKEHQGRRYVLVYNGELYNTEDLRQELVARGHQFRGHSDTEVLLASYIEWGPTCLDYLNGIFAFGVWNEDTQTLFLARDRLGVKPLFFLERADSLLFGSEPKALLAHPDVRPEVDRQGLAEVFGLGPSRTPGHGIFRGFSELRPGHALVYGRNGLRQFRYWELTSRKHKDGLAETAAKVHHLFQDAVERQLVSDRPICTLLSGGLDSSAITAIAANKLVRDNRGPLNTYSIDYQDNEKYFQANDYQPNSDKHWIDLVSQRYRTLHHNKVISQEELAGLLDQAVLVRDQPGMADIDSSLYWFCKEIKKLSTVALSGECADEIFGGYPWFHRPDLYEQPAFPWIQSLADRENLLTPHWRQCLALREYVQDRYNETLREVPELPGEDPEEKRRRQLSYLNIKWFMTTLLDRKDRMSMGASLEVRVPFADHRLVEYVWNIPWKFKIAGEQEKGILRQALTGILPDEVLFRKKSPYPKTHHPAYTKAVTTRLRQIVENPHSPLLEFYRREALDELIRSNGGSMPRPWFGQLMRGPQLLAYLIQINTWLERYAIQVVES